jgi:hypothetical protein
VLSRGGYQWEEGKSTEWMKEAEYGGCILYSCMKMNMKTFFEMVLRRGYEEEQWME